MPDWSIKADNIRVGEDVSIGERTSISAIGGTAEEVSIGDNVFIGDDVRILAPRVRIGDFAIIHHHTTIYGYDEIAIGSCSWIGQNVILNCTAPLTIGAGCTISAYSNIWTHFSGGDPVEGCRFNRQQAASIGADAWIGVQASIAPADIGAKALVLAGSVVTGSVPANTVWGGNPAKDITDKLGRPFEERTTEDKFADLCQLLRDFHSGIRAEQGFRGNLGDDEFSREQEPGRFTLGNLTITMTDGDSHGCSVFDVRDRSYSKLRTPEEVGFMNFMLPLVKFYPRSNGKGE